MADQYPPEPPKSNREARRRNREAAAGYDPAKDPNRPPAAVNEARQREHGPALSKYRVKVWLQGETATFARPTLEELQGQGYVVLAAALHPEHDTIRAGLMEWVAAYGHAGIVAAVAGLTDEEAGGRYCPQEPAP
jgi:hypothetical protein